MNIHKSQLFWCSKGVFSYKMWFPKIVNMGCSYVFPSKMCFFPIKMVVSHKKKVIFPGKKNRGRNRNWSSTKGLNPVAQGPHLGTQRGTGGRQDRPQSNKQPQRAPGGSAWWNSWWNDGFIIYNWRYRHSGESSIHHFTINLQNYMVLMVKLRVKIYNWRYRHSGESSIHHFTINLQNYMVLMVKLRVKIYNWRYRHSGESSIHHFTYNL